MKRRLKQSRAEEIIHRLEYLETRRTKLRFKKISDKRRNRLRGQVRYQLKCLRYLLPKEEEIQSPCNPDTWEVVLPSEREKQNAAHLFAMMAAISSKYKGGF